MQNRFKSWALWVSVASLVGIVLKTGFDIEIAHFDSIVNSLLAVLAGFGIINNPTNKEGF